MAEKMTVEKYEARKAQIEADHAAYVAEMKARAEINPCDAEILSASIKMAEASKVAKLAVLEEEYRLGRRELHTIPA